MKALNIQAEQLQYSREDFLNVYDPGYPLPSDVDLSLSAFVEESRPPLANLPLTNMETKLLNMSSINSEVNRRSTYHHSKKGQRQQQTPVGKKNKDEMWDIPSSATGTFGADGVFGFGSLPLETKPVDNRNSWSVLENNDSSHITSVPASKPDQFSQSFNSFGKNSPQMYMGEGNSISSSAMATSLGINDPHVFNPPAFKFIPPKWYYQDPSKVEQGPFSSEQMHGWYKEGYFPPGLPIRCEGDHMFIPLLQFVERNGSESPFLDSLRDQEALEREYYLQETSRMRPNSFPTNFGVRPMGNAHQYADFGEPNVFFNPVRSAEHKFIPNDSGFKLGFNTAMYQDSSSNFNILEQSVHAQYLNPTRHHVPIDYSLHEKVDANLNPSSLSTPMNFSENQEDKSLSVSQLEIEVDENRDPIKDSKSESLSSPVVKISRKNKARDSATEILNTPVIKSPKKEIEPTFDLGESVHITDQKVPQSAPTAPWATSTTKNRTKASLKEVQEMEKLASEEKKKKESIEAERKILAEAQAIAEKEASGKISLVANSQWASKVAVKPAKSLTEIMEDEAKEKLKAGSSTGSKGYAKIAATVVPGKPAATIKNSTSVVSPIVQPMASMHVKSPSKVSDDWNVVTKGPSAKKSTAIPSVKASSPVSVAVNRVSEPSIKETGSSVLQWCKTVLKSEQKQGNPLLNIDDFVSILMSIDFNERGTISMICNESLGGFAIDIRKFVDQFLKRRAAEASGKIYSGPNESVRLSPSKEDDNDSWTAVGGSTRVVIAESTKPSIASDNKFVVVGKSKKKKGKK